jgi:hypothetical protein
MRAARSWGVAERVTTRDLARIGREALGLTVAERALLADRLLLTLGLKDGERKERWGREVSPRVVRQKSSPHRRVGRALCNSSGVDLPS